MVSFRLRLYVLSIRTLDPTPSVPIDLVKRNGSSLRKQTPHDIGTWKSIVLKDPLGSIVVTDIGNLNENFRSCIKKRNIPILLHILTAPSPPKLFSKKFTYRIGDGNRFFFLLDVFNTFPYLMERHPPLFNGTSPIRISSILNYRIFRWRDGRRFSLGKESS